MTVNGYPQNYWEETLILAENYRHTHLCGACKQSGYDGDWVHRHRVDPTDYQIYRANHRKHQPCPKHAS